MILMIGKNIQNKRQFQIREFPKTNFGGAPKIFKNPDWIKLIN
jgi:hypothetical protein